ncbi:hypothetical protein [Streptomyces rubradiris]|uniref:Uncharacterized protein n=1 Tax=Streptomyces rubradiris TaxID=285531 RepID=A0ABQ3RA95_STRRR|nr:hypothetical protein [Streptomyces rubradiris]GHH25938.1 hypothetical protein GCM10018792_65730 [Streptomyces rubradiris]GHI52778.1 hypothetical protein Srubr_26240 [Streptomyces rubradiris]
MKITIEGASEEFTREVLRLAAQQGANLTVRTVKTGWTAERAERFLRSLPAGARTFARLVVVDGGGHADADTLRAALGRLNGPAVALARAVPRGVKAGWWPEGTPDPIEKVDDPDRPSWKKAEAYVMSRDLVPLFRAAFDRLAATQQAARAAGLHPGGAGKTSMSWTPDSVSERGFPGVKVVDVDGGSAPAGGDQDDDGVMECRVCLQPYRADEEGTATHLDTSRDADHTPRS